MKSNSRPAEFDTITGDAAIVGGVAILSPTPFQFVNGVLEIKGNVQVDGFAYYRLAYFEGLDPANVQVIVDNITEQKNNEPIAAWDVSNLEEGLYTLLLTVFRGDGTFVEASSQVTVDTTPPEARILFPLQDQTIFTDEDFVIVQAQVTDNLSVAKVEFYADGAQVPFAVNTVSPFTEKWPIPGPGCHSFRVVAWDAAAIPSTSGQQIFAHFW